jgi:Flp pilus assembly protein TadD
VKSCRNIASALTLAVAVAGCPSSQTTQIQYGGAAEDIASVGPGAYQAYLAAELALNRGDEATAVAQLETALSFDPDSPYLHVRLAEIHARRGRGAQAHQNLAQALRLDRDHPEALVLLGRLYWQEGKGEQAETAFKRCIAKNPTLPAAYIIYAELLERRDRPAEARTVLESMVSRVRDAADGHANLAMLCLRQMDYPCAARHLRSVLQQQADPETLVRLAHVHRSRGQMDVAVRLLREAFDRSGGNAGVAATLVEVLEQQGQPQAIDDLLAVMEGDAEQSPEQIGELAGLCLDARRPQRALALVDAQLKQGDSPVLQIERAEALARLGRGKEARELLRKELGGARGPAAATRLARILQREGAFAEASEALRQALRRQPENDSLVIALSSALHLEGKSDAGVQVVRDALAKRPTERALIFGLGAAQERAGQWREAIETMRRILAKNPKDAPVHNFIGYTLVEHGEDLKNAERSIRQALFLSPGEGYIIDSLGWLSYRQGRLAEAQQLLEMAVRLAPREPEVLAHLAEVDASRSNLAGALRLLKQAVLVSEDLKLTAKLKKRLHELDKGRVGAR